MKQAIHSEQAPQAIGAYSQAIKVGNIVYTAGQIPLDPTSMQLVEGIKAQIHQVFKNLSAVAEASGGSLQDVVKLSVFLTDLIHFPLLNQIMAGYFKKPYPARSAIGVKSLPKEALVEVEAVLVLSEG
jgi:reactive intermediate/imine deaminase